MKLALSLATLGLTLALTACGSETVRTSFKLRPRYTPTSEIDVEVRNNLSSPIAIAAIVDERPDPDAIGRNSEESPAVKIVVAPQSVPRLVEQAFTEELKAAGFSLDASSQTRFTVTVLELWVKEDNMYKGSAHFRIDIERGGAKVASLTIGGEASRWGSSLSEENYNEVLSDCIVNAIQNLVESPDFQKAVAPDGSTAPPQAAAAEPT